jgi:hypothetical protein
MVNHKGANPVENKNQQIKKEIRTICIQSRGNKINLRLNTDQMLLFPKAALQKTSFLLNSQYVNLCLSCCQQHPYVHDQTMNQGNKRRERIRIQNRKIKQEKYQENML